MIRQPLQAWRTSSTRRSRHSKIRQVVVRVTLRTEVRMGLSFRSSLKMGPLRVNVSGTGVGLSAGVRGARVSVGPRGTYVTLSAGGFRYQKKLNSGLQAAQRP